MKKERNLLFIDDRALFVQMTKSLLGNYLEKKFNFNFFVICEYNLALDKLEKFKEESIHIDIVVLNIDINYNNYHGLVLVNSYIKKIRSIFPETNIIISTSSNESYRINQIIKKNNPSGIIIENKSSENYILELFKNVLNYKKHYSRYILSILNKHKLDFIAIDEVDFYILYLLKQGIKTNYFQFYIPRSNSLIEKRKSNLKDKFLLANRSDEELVQEAIKRGILSKHESCKDH